MLYFIIFSCSLFNISHLYRPRLISAVASLNKIPPTCSKSYYQRISSTDNPKQRVLNKDAFRGRKHSRDDTGEKRDTIESYGSLWTYTRRRETSRCQDNTSPTLR